MHIQHGWIQLTLTARAISVGSLGRRAKALSLVLTGHACIHTYHIHALA
jgi:hypothetical protein